MEEELFKNVEFDEAKLLSYGFKKNKNEYKYDIDINNHTMLLEIMIKAKKIKLRVIDKKFQEEYINYRINSMDGAFVSEIRAEIKNIATDIIQKCGKKGYFNLAQTKRLITYLKDEYNCIPEFAWDKYPGFAILRHENNKKWFGIIMNLNKEKLDSKTNQEIEVINVKIEPSKILELIKKPGFYPAYHMNKKYWLTICLDDTVSDEVLQKLVQESYENTLK